MIRAWRLLVIAMVLGLAAPADAQQSPPAEFQQGPPTAEEVLSAYRALVDHGRDRPFFGLPERVTWRVPGPIGIAFYAVGIGGVGVVRVHVVPGGVILEVSPGHGRVVKLRLVFDNLYAEEDAAQEQSGQQQSNHPAQGFIA